MARYETVYANESYESYGEESQVETKAVGRIEVPLVRIAINLTWEGKPKEIKNSKPKVWDYFHDGKPVRGPLNLATRWLNTEIPLERLFEVIKLGGAVCPQLLSKDNQFVVDKADGYRDTNRFVRSSVVMIDIDYGPSIKDIQEHEFYKLYGTGIYTSASHTEQEQRFRIVFRLETDVEDKEDMRHLQIALIDTFGGDPACKDPARIFFGAVNCWQEINPERFIPDDVQAQLISQGRTVIKDKKKAQSSGFQIADGELYTTQSELYLDPEKPLFRDDGTFIYLKDIKGKVSDLRCPFHDDKKGTEFADYSEKSKSPYFVCHRCSPRAIWPRHDTADTIFKKKIAGVAVGKAIYAEQYLRPIDLVPGVTLTKSPKGTGKTYRVKPMVKEIKEKGLSVLLIAHRVSLLRSLANRLGLQFYGDLKKSGKAVRPQFLAICANSLDMISSFAKPYDVIILDESEQVLQHIAGDTLQEKRRELVRAFYNHIQKAKYVYALDADLGMLTVDSLYDLIGERLPYQYIINEYKKEQEVSLWESKAELVQAMYAAIKSGKKVFITTSSKKFVDREFINIQKILSELPVTSDLVEIENDYTMAQQEHAAVLKITSEVSKSPDVQAFFADPDKHSKKYRVIITSPSTSTGVDIKTRFDAVFGFFESEPSTHYDIDQQIWRVRNSDEQHVWIAPQQYNRQTDWLDIKFEILASDKRTKALLPEYQEVKEEPWVEKYLNLVSRVEAHQNESKNHLRRNWCNLRKDNGWKIKWIPKEEKDTAAVFIENPEDKEKARQARISAIINASQLDEQSYILLKRKKQLTLEEKGQIEKHELETFYREPITEALIELDDDGLRQDVKGYERYTADWEKLQKLDLKDRAVDKHGIEVHVADRKNLTDRFKLLYSLLEKIGLETLDETVEVHKDNIAPLVGTLRKNKSRVESVLHLTVKNSSNEKGYEMQLVGAILKRVGMELVKIRDEQIRVMDEETGKKVNKKKCFYGISSEKKQLLEKIKANRVNMQQRKQ